MNETSRQPLVSLRGITKRFPGVLALDKVDLEIFAGEVHVLLGENGAGKSTLINIMAGTYSPEEGAQAFFGDPVERLTPHKARLAGISPVFQEFSLIPELTVEENLFLGREHRRYGFLINRTMRETVRKTLSDLDFELDGRLRIRDLSRAEQQMVEIAKAMLQDVRVLILDEPTASLTEREATKLFDLIRRLKGAGVGIVYVSHRMAEIREIGDKITILRDGRKIATVDSDECDDAQLVEMMTGRRIDVLFPRIDHRRGAPRLSVEGMDDQAGSILGADLEVCAGEIVGIAGLVGCGKSELARSIFGLHPIAAGTIRLKGEVVARPRPGAMLKNGLCYFPSDRVAEGLSLPRPVRENATIAALDLEKFSRGPVMKLRSEAAEIGRLAETLRLRPGNIERAVTDLSGGNRQKVMLMRGLVRDIDVFVFDEPTVGVDVGAKVQFYELFKDLVEAGAAVLLVSSELLEILNLCNRVYVMRQGKIVSELPRHELTEAAVLNAIFGRERDEVSA